MSRKRKVKTDFKTTLKKRAFFIFFGLCLAGISAGILWFSGRVSTLDCRRVESTQIECDVQTKWLGLLPLEGQPIHQLQGASVDRNCSRDIRAKQSRETCTYSVDLTTAEGVVSLSPYLVSGGNQEHKYAFVDQVNAFVNNSNMPSLQTIETELGPQTVVLGLLLLLGLAMIIINTSRAISETQWA